MTLEGKLAGREGAREWLRARAKMSIRIVVVVVLLHYAPPILPT